MCRGIFHFSSCSSITVSLKQNRDLLFLLQVVAIVMDLLTDLQILQDLLDASARRGVAVYAVLEAKGAPHFLDMCTRLQIGATHLRVSRG